MRFLRRVIYYCGSLFRIMFNFKRWPSALFSILVKDDQKTHLVTLRRPLLKFITRGGMDVWSIKETILDGFYTRYGVPIRDGWNVLDVGAGIGDFCIYAAYGNPNTTVYAYEPFLESYKLLVRNINLNGFEKIFPVNSAIWGSDGTLQLDTSSGEPLKIMSLDAGEEEDISKFVKVKAISLAQVLAQHEIDMLDIMKLDCEGAEYEVLMNSSVEVFNRIDRIIMEYHDIDENHHHDKLALFLEGMGYKVSCYDNFVHRDIGYLFAQRMDIY